MSRHASLNRAYALVWNDGQQAYVPAPETTRRGGKRKATVLATAIAAVCTSAFSYADGAVGLGANALPTGGASQCGASQHYPNGRANADSANHGSGGH